MPAKKGTSKPKARYAVELTTRERGWSPDTWIEHYPTEKKALERVKEINSQNTARYAPDIYTVADYKGKV